MYKNRSSEQDRTRFTKSIYDFPSDLGYAHDQGKFIEVGGSSENDYSSVVSMQVWAVNENNNNLRLSNEQWSVLMEEIKKLNPNLKFKKNIFNSNL